MLSIPNLKRQLKSGKAIIRREKAEDFLSNLPKKPLFDLTVTSPPYDIGKSYEKRIPLSDYLEWQKNIIKEIVSRTKPTGSICWQVGNYTEEGAIRPLDIEFAPIFYDLGLKLRNRIIWHYGHGFHQRRRFSGRYETILWFTKSDEYVFNLDAVRVPSKYPGKRHFKGAHKGELSGNPLGKNPEDVWAAPAPDDVWDIPHVVGNHVEKTAHPCQFPVGLVQRLVLALSNESGLVFDPFAGSGSTAVAALSTGRTFIGTEISEQFVDIAKGRIERAKKGEEPFRPFDRPIYDNTQSNLSKRPEEWQ